MKNVCKNIIVLFICLFPMYSFSQVNKDTVYSDLDVDSLPRLIVNGKQVSLNQYIDQHLIWSDFIIESERIASKYVIDGEGNLKSIEVVKFPGACDSCTREFVRILTSMPKWNPAKRKNKNVSVRLSDLYTFRIIR